ncbi:MAG: carbohydrate kinase [Salinivirgaceae bacterium]|nr:carbohydrate kinase [Salinivirgaceae bacterium]
MIYTLGEIVLDIITQDFDNMRAKPGGSMLNTAITLGRLGMGVNHISYLSVDQNGRLILDFLAQNNVGANYIFLTDKVRTNLAFAHLDKQNKAHYTFYKDDLDDYKQMMFPNIHRNDVVIFGSFFALNSRAHDVLRRFLQKAKSSGALLIYDPNFRASDKPRLNELMPYIEDCVSIAHIVKASDEDVETIFKTTDGSEAWGRVSALGAKVLIMTKGKDGAIQYSKEGNTHVNGCEIQSVSTIGAGDTFTSGLVYQLTQMSQIQNVVNDEHVDWLPALKTANEFASQVCMSYENYLSWEYIRSRNV